MTKKDRDELLQIVRNGRINANHPERLFIHQISKNPDLDKLREDFPKIGNELEAKVQDETKS